ncbi:MAG: thioredoxin domain-containing protein [Nitrospinota bacterium]
MNEHTNHLADETSPYLLQHRHNPVNWHPWGDEALTRAREEDRPIFLSIGYSACHWCHVMERESFESGETAAVLNEHFVSIKVDREERPDLDAIYMEAVQMMTGQGGWPMSMFLLPDLRPFFGGTYFPPDDRYGRPGFRSLLLRLAEIYRTRRGELEENAGKLTGSMREMSGAAPLAGGFSQESIARAANELSDRFDSSWGGFGQAPKFPPSVALMLLLREWRRGWNADHLAMVEFTLQRMALGGMYDQLGGGFHRYSVDPYWLVPHFEKMLYDNALLARVYLEAHQATGSTFYRSVATDTLDYVLREMTSPEGGFYSAQDADSEGEEGKFFVWTLDEAEAVLEPEDARIFCAFYGITEEGNFEGKSILRIQRAPNQFCEEEEIGQDELLEVLERSRQKMFAVREKRIKPGLDDKVLTSWNGLMIGAMALAGRITGEESYLEAGRRAADFVLTRMRGESGLLRTHRAGVSRLNAYLDDYAFMMMGLVDLYETSFEVRWLDAAASLAREAIDRYWDEREGGFFFTSNDHEELIVRKKISQDGAIPSGNSVAALSLLRLGKLTGDDALSERGAETIRAFGQYIERAPAAFHMMLVALDFYLDEPMEIAVVGDPGEEDTQAALRAVNAEFVPNKVLAFRPASGGGDLEKKVPLLEGKITVNGAAAVYLCRNYACELPITDAGEVKERLRPAGGRE